MIAIVHMSEWTWALVVVDAAVATVIDVVVDVAAAIVHAVTVDIVDVNDVVATAATFHVAATVDDGVALLTLLLLLLLLTMLFIL